MHVSLDKFGRILIPKRLRDMMGLEPGAKLRLDVQKGEKGIRKLEITNVSAKAPLVREGALLVFTGRLDRDKFDPVKEVRRVRDERTRKILERMSPDS